MDILHKEVEVFSYPLVPLTILKTFSKSILNDDVSTNSDAEVDDM